MKNLRRFPARIRRSLSSNRFYAYLAVLGPGIIAANAGNDASGIATYSTIGAGYGYSLLWAFVPITVSLIVVQEMCVRMGVVTGQGLADLIREQFGVRWTTLVMSALLIANIGVIISEFIGIAQASELFGISRYITIPLTAAAIWWLVVKGTQKRIEQVFLAMSLVFFGYVISAFLAKPVWSTVAAEMVEPSFSFDSGYLFTVMALIGTTITPFMQVYVQSSVVEKGLDKEDYPLVRADVIVGTIFACTIAAFIVICTAATLNIQGITELDSAATAAQALVPVAGVYAKYLFAVGLFGAAMLAMGVLPLATAYSVSEALGFEKGLSHSFREAPIFLGIFTSLILIGSIVALIPGIPQIKLLLFTQCINGLLLPFILVAIVSLASSREIMGEYKNGFLFNLVAWIITIIVSILSLLLLATTIVDIF
ncbi:MAG TPA: divalent metal cation transporter [Pyrinomonadaceae bacterium]|nr:divalent metal cation transporter [Pyrinomonadaceae bacterium]